MIQKDGHMDVASSRRMCKMIIEDANDILDALPRDMEASLPTWWTNKLAKCSAYINGARDYLVYSEAEVQPVEPQMPEMPEGQVNVGGYQTQHFDICPSAQELYKDIEVSDESIRSAMLQDMLFKIEKQAISANDADEAMVTKAQRIADMIMDLAEEMDLEEEHSYVEDTHMAKIKELAGMKQEEGEEDMLPPSAKMVKNAS